MKKKVIMSVVISVVVVLIGVAVFLTNKNFDYPEKTLKYKHIRRISD